MSTMEMLGDTDLACLSLLARFHGVAVDAESLRHEHGSTGKPFSADQSLLAARAQAQGQARDLDRRPVADRPAAADRPG